MKPKTVIIFILLVIFAIIFIVATSWSKITYNPALNDSKPKYVCPKTEYIDCMPSIDRGSQQEKICNDKEYLNWAQINCPNFKGIAY
ncbi:hypothetical protein A2V49_01270 [candidate division WWE3 bacterium RBG_19FT_COMBO_34_6]|uniref:Uncharacterized protein n=1 Tax=candidate division WWE3 bacterium RBG_19FT_COMBO_34_6 TaxID=1802612 RepID=A0A1F4UJR2_UNCKA|nr:MAG: hypothetical protein A2V49_01270 [candidate division WWE3 bacterium RBG_19FT_COMBO_34_6]